VVFTVAASHIYGCCTQPAGLGRGRVSKADKARVFAIARAEAGEAAAAVEIAVAAGDADAESLEAVLVHADKFVAMMTGLIR
jgi:four helix bundle protein